MFRSSALPIAAAFLIAAPLRAQTAPQSSAAADTLSRVLTVLRDELGIPAIPDSASFLTGATIIAAGDTMLLPVGVHGGSLTVRGFAASSVVVVDGDLILEPGGTVAGDAIAVRGNVVMNGGVIRGATTTLRGDLRPSGVPAALRTPVEQMWHELAVAFTTLALVIGLGIVVFLFGRGQLEGTATALAARPGRSFLIGVLSQLAIAPAFVLLNIALALTIIGLLLIPFAAFVFLLAILGVGALGLLAGAQVAGDAMSGRAAHSGAGRSSALRSLLLGILSIGGVWIVAAALTSIPVAGAAVRGFAVVMTWVVVTAGFGAAVLSRAGARTKSSMSALEAELAAEVDTSWQTPTPVTGVAAARRPLSGTGAQK